MLVAICVSVCGLPVPLHDYAVAVVFPFPVAVALIFTGENPFREQPIITRLQ